MTNSPIWKPIDAAASPGASAQRGGFQEVWYLKLNDPFSNRALWLRFTLLISANGFKKVAETWAIYFDRKDSREISKVALKQTHDIQKFSNDFAGSKSIRIGECELSDGHTRGMITSMGKSIRWDLKIVAPRSESFDYVPKQLAKSGIVKNFTRTVYEDARFTGTSEVDGEKQVWTAAPGMQGHLAGPKNGHSWVWGHCNAFVNEQGTPVPFVFEGLTARSRLGGMIASPKMSAFYFHYQGQEYLFNSLLDAFRSRSESTLTEWKFQADRGDLSFRGTASAQYKDFAGVTYEDTDGTLLYCANSKLSDMKVLVYRRGKLEATFKSPGTAAFEVVSRVKNPYVPLLI